MLRLRHGKVDGTACGDWRAGRCETWRCLPRKGEIRATPSVGRGAGVDNLKFHLSFHVQSARRQGGAELQHEGLCVVVWKGSVCFMSSHSCLASEYVMKKIQLQETESRENGTEMPPVSFPPPAAPLPRASLPLFPASEFPPANRPLGSCHSLCSGAHSRLLIRCFLSHGLQSSSFWGFWPSHG